MWFLFQGTIIFRGYGDRHLVGLGGTHHGGPAVEQIDSTRQACKLGGPRKAHRPRVPARLPSLASNATLTSASLPLAIVL